MKILDALRGENLGPPPAWIMRQAGRYLPSYQALRAKYSLLTLFTEPDLIVETTLLPLARYPLDAAILFSDITLIGRAFGLTVDFVEGKGPQVTGDADKNLSIEEALPFLRPAMSTLREKLHVPLIGFAGAPFTTASYLFPKTTPALLEALTEKTIELMQWQVENGAKLFQLFESAGDLLSEEERRISSYPYIEKIIQAATVPVIVFYKGSFPELDAPLSVDGSQDLHSLRAKFPRRTLQGNLPPSLLFEDKATIQREVRKRMLAGDPAYIFNLGHGILPKTPPHAVDWMLEEVQR